MKKIIFLLITIVSIGLISCEKNSEPTPDEAISREFTVELTKANKDKKNSAKSNTTLTGIMKINLIDEESDLLEFELSDELIAQIGLPKDDFYNIIYDELNNQGYLTKTTAKNLSKEDSDYKKCRTQCHKDHTDPESGEKTGPRGWCKAGCFGQAVLDAIVKKAPEIVVNIAVGLLK